MQLRTKDQFRRNWASENYLTILEDSQRIVFTIETGSHNNIPRELRICQKCKSNSNGDKFHYLFVCIFLLCNIELLVDFIDTNINGRILRSTSLKCIFRPKHVKTTSFRQSFLCPVEYPSTDNKKQSASLKF